MTPTKRPILDVDKLVRWRVAAGFSQRQLSRQVGLSTIGVSTLEQPAGDNHGDLSLRTLTRLADALGVEPRGLLSSDGEAPAEVAPAPDDVKVEAVLFEVGAALSRTDLAQALGWELARVNAAVTGLRGRLTGTGQRLVGGSRLRLQARQEMLDEAELSRARALAQKADGRGFDHGCARVLRQVLDGEVDSSWEARASNPQRVTLGRLANLGLIEKWGSAWAASESVEFSFPPAAESA